MTEVIKEIRDAVVVGAFLKLAHRAGPMQLADDQRTEIEQLIVKLQRVLDGQQQLFGLNVQLLAGVTMYAEDGLEAVVENTFLFHGTGRSMNAVLAMQSDAMPGFLSRIKHIVAVSKVTNDMRKMLGDSASPDEMVHTIAAMIDAVEKEDSDEQAPAH